MGKRDKKPNRRRHKGEFSNDGEDLYDQHPPASPSVVDEDEENSEEEEEEGSDELQSSSPDLTSKFLLYQQSVQVTNEYLATLMSLPFRFQHYFHVNLAVV